MERIERVTAVIEREGEGYVALCPGLDIASQGDTIEDARANLQEALALFMETASPEEVADRFHSEVYVSHWVGSGAFLGARCAASSPRTGTWRSVVAGAISSCSAALRAEPERSRSLDHAELLVGKLQSIIRQSELPRAVLESEGGVSV